MGRRRRGPAQAGPRLGLARRAEHGCVAPRRCHRTRGRARLPRPCLVRGDAQATSAPPRCRGAATPGALAGDRGLVLGDRRPAHADNGDDRVRGRGSALGRGGRARGGSDDPLRGIHRAVQHDRPTGLQHPGRARRRHARCAPGRRPAPRGRSDTGVRGSARRDPALAEVRARLRARGPRPGPETCDPRPARPERPAEAFRYPGRMTDVAPRPGDSSEISGRNRSNGQPKRVSDPSPSARPPKQEQEPASEEVTEVAPGILRMQLPIWMPGLGHVNMYVLQDDRGIAVVDPGLPGPASWRIRRAADAELITHEAFTTWSFGRRGATLSADEAERIERAAIEQAANYRGPSLEELPAMVGEPDEVLRQDQRRSAPWGGDTPWGGGKHPMPPFRRRVMIRALRLLFNPPDPTRRVRHGAPLELAGRQWLAIHTPGHTLDHLCLFDPEHGVLLAGDHVLPTITPHISGSGKADALRSYLATLDLVASLDGVQLALPAHGHPFGDLAGRVEAIKDHHVERTELLRAVSAAVGPLD